MLNAEEAIYDFAAGARDGPVAGIGKRPAPAIAEPLEARQFLSAAAPTASGRATEVAYLKFVADHHTVGVKMAQLAQSKAQSDLLEEMADMAAADQSREIVKVRGWLKDWYGIDYRPKVDAAGQQVLNSLKKLGGGVFDVEFAEEFTKHHLDIVERSLDDNDRLFHEKAETFAENIVVKQGAEISGLGKVLQSYGRTVDFPLGQSKLSAAEQQRREIAYLKFTADHHTMGVAMADIADDKASRPWLKDLARRAKADQAAEVAKVRGWLKQWYGIDYKPTLSAMDQQDLAKLRSATRGADFDLEFSTMFAMHHAQIVARSNEAIDGVFRGETESLAEHIMEEQGEEIGDLGAVLLSYSRSAEA